MGTKWTLLPQNADHMRGWNCLKFCNTYEGASYIKNLGSGNIWKGYRLIFENRFFAIFCVNYTTSKINLSTFPVLLRNDYGVNRKSMTAI